MYEHVEVTFKFLQQGSRVDIFKMEYQKNIIFHKAVMTMTLYNNSDRL